jgi:AcrR family transcriptional regulator
MLRSSSYEGVTLDAVARAAGAAKTTLYRRWPSKADLVGKALLPLIEPAIVSEGTTLRIALTIIAQRMIDLLTGEFGEAIAGVVNDPLASRDVVEELLDLVTARKLLVTLHGSRATADAIAGAIWLRIAVRRETSNEMLAHDIVAAVL